MKLWPRREQQNEELNQEIQSHLRMAINERIERGESRASAESSARREMGNERLIEEATKDQWGWRWLEHLLQDARYGLRMLRKNPGFTAITVLTLALGIGANTALFSVVNGVLLNPLPFPHPEQLITLHASKPNFETGSISFPNFLDWEKDNHTFSGMAIYRGTNFTLTGLGETERVRADLIAPDFFRVLGVKPEMGRTFVQKDDQQGAAPVVLISAGFGKRKFGSSPGILGKTLALDGKDYTIVGVIPAGFNSGLTGFRDAEVYVPIIQWSNNLLQHRSAGLGFHGIGRLKPGATLRQARADMDQVAQNLAAAFPEADKGTGASLVPLRERMVGDIQPFLLLLLAAVGFVMLIACVNVASLLLARSTGRAREFAVRAALGAGRGRVVRQLLTESVLLAIAGGAFGLLLASWGTQAAIKKLPEALPRAAGIGLDTHVLIFTLAISCLAGILFGLAPALKISRTDLQETLKEGGRAASSRRHAAQRVFVTAELALAFVLLIGAGLMIRSLSRLWSVNPGFDSHNVLTFAVSLPPPMQAANPNAIRAALREIHRRIDSMREIQAASYTWGAFPMGWDDEELFWLEGQPKPANLNDMNWSLKYIVDPDYLAVMKIPLQRGRFLTPQDTDHTPRVVVVDDVLAYKYFGNEDPIGKLINIDDSDTPVQIVGVVGHVKQWGLDSDDRESLRAQMYLSFMQMDDVLMKLMPAGVGIVVRSAGNSPGLFDSLRHALQSMNSQQVVYGAQTMDEIISDTLATRRFSMILLGSFAALALLLASVGIYGVISYLVGQRTHEIGIRMALGAQRKDVLRLVLGEGARMAFLGIGIGIVAALMLTRVMSKMLYGVSATDPLTFAGVALILVFVALAACYIPARRAMRIDPMVALRYE
jgi:predicted permease